MPAQAVVLADEATSYIVLRAQLFLMDHVSSHLLLCAVKLTLNRPQGFQQAQHVGKRVQFEHGERL